MSLKDRKSFQVVAGYLVADPPDDASFAAALVCALNAFSPGLIKPAGRDAQDGQARLAER
jgi:hypothetical protein